MSEPESIITLTGLSDIELIVALTWVALDPRKSIRAV